LQSDLDAHTPDHRHYPRIFNEKMKLRGNAVNGCLPFGLAARPKNGGKTLDGTPPRGWTNGEAVRRKPKLSALRNPRR
jgi:hypothetical protein